MDTPLLLASPVGIEYNGKQYTCNQLPLKSVMELNSFCRRRWLRDTLDALDGLSSTARARMERQALRQVQTIEYFSEEGLTALCTDDGLRLFWQHVCPDVNHTDNTLQDKVNCLSLYFNALTDMIKPAGITQETRGEQESKTF